MTFNNLNDLFRYIERQTQDTMRNEVAETAKDAMSKTVNSAVYGVYQPEYYRRRGLNGGLADKDNYTVEEIHNGIIVTNDTPLDNGNNEPRLDDIICNGLGRQPFPRDFFSEAENELLRTQVHKQALKKGLRDRGIDVE